MLLDAFLLLYVAALVIALGINAAQAFALSRLGATPIEVQLFFGPTIFRTELRPGVFFSLRAIPASSAVRLPEDALPDAWEDLPAVPTALVRALPLLILATLGVALLGPARFADSFLGGFGQIVRGAFSPLEVGVPLVTGALLELSRSGPHVLVGVWCAKWVAFNLFPLPNMILGQIVMPLITPKVPDPHATLDDYPAWVGHVTCLGGLLTLVLCVPWLVAVGMALTR